MSTYFEDKEHDDLQYECRYDTNVNDEVLLGASSPCTDITGLTINNTLHKVTWNIQSSAQDSYEFAFFAHDGDLYSPAMKFIVNTIDATNDIYTGNLLVWLQSKEAYLYKDTNLDSNLSDFNQQVKGWRNTINTGSQFPLIAANKENGSVTYENLGANGEGLKFNKSRTDSYLELPDGKYHDSSENITFIIHARSPGTLSSTYNAPLFSIGEDINSTPLRINLDYKNNLSYTVNDPLNTFTYIDGPTLYSSTNHCIAITFQGNDKKLYYNGDLQENLSLQGNPSAGFSKFLADKLPIYLGQKSPNDSFGWDGHIKEFLIWGETLNETQVQSECSRVN